MLPVPKKESRKSSTASTFQPYPTPLTSRTAAPFGASKPPRISESRQGMGSLGDSSDLRTRLQTRPDLFTPTSNFPSHILPPLGSKPRDLDLDITTQTFELNQEVCVRQFLGERKGWTSWREGVVVGKQKVASYAGSHGHAYIVRRKAADGSYEPLLEKYAAFYAEIRSKGASDYREVDPKVCARQREQSDMVYAKIPILNQDSRTVVWSPVRVLHWKSGEEPAKVMSTDSLTSGRIFDVTEILPYTPETAKACRIQGHRILDPKT